MLSPTFDGTIFYVAVFGYLNWCEQAACHWCEGLDRLGWRTCAWERKLEPMAISFMISRRALFLLQVYVQFHWSRDLTTQWVGFSIVPDLNILFSDTSSENTVVLIKQMEGRLITPVLYHCHYAIAVFKLT